MTRPRTFGLLAALTLALLGGYMLAQQTRTVETEVRINARQLEDGRVEFALQQREGSGWGERILPRQRLFPADPGNDRWLNSSPVTVNSEVEVAEPAASTPSTTSSANEGRAAFGVEAFESAADGRILYFHGDAGVNGLRTTLRVNGTTDDSLYEDAKIYFICDHDVQSLWVAVEAGVYIGEEWHEAGLNDHDGITLAAFGTLSQQEWDQRGFITYDDDAQIGSASGASMVFFVTALNHRWLTVSLPQYSDDITATFDLQGAFTTPVQWLLFGCNRLTAENAN